VNAATSDYTTTGRFFIVGSQPRIHQAMADPGLRSFLSNNQTIKKSGVSMTTDDWPYFYQRERGVPLSFVVLSLVLVVFCWQLLRRTGTDLASLHWHFFFLGAGFMLLEAQIVSKMALLFGTTWLVNSVVVGGLLLLIVAANSPALSLFSCVRRHLRFTHRRLSHPAGNILFPIHLAESVQRNRRAVPSSFLCGTRIYSQFRGRELQRRSPGIQSFRRAGRWTAGISFLLDRNQVPARTGGDSVWGFLVGIEMGQRKSGPAGSTCSILALKVPPLSFPLYDLGLRTDHQLRDRQTGDRNSG